MYRKKFFHKKEGAIDGAIISVIVVMALIMFTLYGIKMRVAKNVKYETEDAVVMAATSAEVTDLYLYSSTGEIALDCTGDGHSEGMYDDKYSATEKACEIAFDRFRDNLETTLHMDSSLVPTEKSGYLKKAEVKEFTVYNVLDDLIYCSTYNGTSFQNTTSHPHHTITVNARGTDVDVQFTSIYISIEFEVEMFGKEFTIPFTEYVYIND